MIFKNKNKFRPIYKPLVNLNENVQNREKLLQFKKKKWQKIISIYQRTLNIYKKIKPKDQTQYLVSRYPNVNFAYKKQHRNTLKEIKKFKLIYGGLLNKIVKRLLNKNNKRRVLNRLIFFKQFESRLDVTLFRSKFGSNIRYLRQQISHGKVFVNKTKVTLKSYILKPGDTIQIKLKCYKNLENSILRSL